MAAQLAWIGLGNMGRGMCKNLIEKGNLSKPLIIYNRTRKRADDLSATTGGQTAVAATIAEAVARADIIFTCVGDDKAIADTLAQAVAGPARVRGKLFVDCSTVHPDTTAQLAKVCNAQGAEFVAMPVFGAPAMADNGQLVCVLAGPAAAVDKVRPYTTGVVGRAVIDFSGQPQSKATLLKIIGNTFILNMVETLAQGHALAEKSGLGVDNLQQFIETMFPGPYFAYSKRMSTGDYYKREEPLFAVDLARKDAKHALAIAKASGTSLRNMEVADSHLEAVQKHMGSKGDIAGIYGAVRQESGLPFEV
ncbi:hypothetical protein GLOTRDRAFT_79197 [Gloeophyllum trabeum ATCC 11539]|uniref:6-phosphogluconate dehydrogenase NADP-binding domain-containing protein n=1 Tax=Gloeophyllum trabeum (strain ATCC 11539 / FP-39264 / Madison 617) TaxID=670483 RepID=S7RFZ5_GLOTA|nr:uncharacterized protein GLOTRDRAFT_79197 [Gloeophyllum trabeum ATCC 11539]EPQ53130.1 hypothetical protein GLOTRDRAFT_79197 [Gloeophyllum trabeum ATCC 11539]